MQNSRYILLCLALLIQSTLFTMSADNEIYIIQDMDLESVIIGGQKKTVGDIFYAEDSVEWPNIANCRIYVVKKSVILKRVPQRSDIIEMNNVKEKISGNPAYKYMLLGRRGGKEANNIFRLKKGNKLLIPVKHLPMQNMKPEVVWGNNFINTIRRSADDKNYELTDDIFLDLKKNSIITITIRETSVTDASVVENVYQDLIVVYVP